MKVDLSFVGFKTLGDPVLQGALEQCTLFFNDLIQNKNPRTISLFGVSGTGKTMLARAMYRKFKDEYRYTTKKYGELEITALHNCCSYNGMKLVNYLRNGEYYLLNEIEQAHMLFIDDIFAENPTENMNAHWFDIINRRCGKWTILTSNKSVEHIAENIDTRIASRLIRDGSKIIKFDTVDFSLRG